MDNTSPRTRLLEAAGLRIDVDFAPPVAALRYFDHARFTAILHPVLGMHLPEPLRQISGRFGGDYPLLAWRSPTETLVLSRDPASFATLAAALAGQSEGYLVDQTGGVATFSLTGPRAADLIVRLGATTAVPNPGDALTGRLAELTVMSLCAAPSQLTLLVDRVYADHLLRWIEVTLEDFEVV